MALFKFPARKATAAAPPPEAAPPAAPAPRTKTLADLEREMGISSPVLHPRPMQSPQPVRRKSGLWGKLMILTVLLGVPAAALWAVNLPYPVVRRPVARNAPLLLLPSYVSMDQNFREAIALVEQSKQLIDSATSFADIELGGQILTEAQAKLDALPLDLMDYWHGGVYGMSYGRWRYSPIAFQQYRQEVGGLQAKVFQEQNANAALVSAEQALSTAKQNFQAAPDELSKRTAMTEWRTALNQLNLIPPSTLAGEIAAQNLATAEAEFRDTVGLLAESEVSAAIIAAARGLGYQASAVGQNPPHKIARWQEAERLWLKAIQELAKISPYDVGYQTAQDTAAVYQLNLSEIRIRMQAEQDAVALLATANRDIQRLTDDRYLTTNAAIGQLEEIVHNLRQIPDSTTVYADAEFLIQRAQARLTQLGE